MFDPSKLTADSNREVVQKPAGSALFENLSVGRIIACNQGEPTAGKLDARGYLWTESGKGMFLPAPKSAPLCPPRTVEVRNCFFHDIDNGTARHSEGLFIATDPADVFNRLTVIVRDSMFRDIGGGGIHFDSGSGRLAFIGVTMAGFIGYPNQINIKLMPGCKLQLVLDGCTASVGLDLAKLGGAAAGTVLTDVWIRNHTGSLPATWGGAAVHSNVVPDGFDTAPPSASGGGQAPAPPVLPDPQIAVLQAQVTSLTNQLGMAVSLGDKAVSQLNDWRKFWTSFTALLGAEDAAHAAVTAAMATAPK